MSESPQNIENTSKTRSECRVPSKSFFCLYSQQGFRAELAYNKLNLRSRWGDTEPDGGNGAGKF